MKKYNLILIFLFCTGYVKAQNIDTVFIKKTTLNKENNSFEYFLIYQSGKKCYEIYRKTVTDFSAQLEYSFSYSDTQKKYDCYGIYDLTTGITWILIHNKRKNSFYISDAYDLKALGDKPVQKSADFKHKNMAIETVSDLGNTEYYKVKLNPISLKKYSVCGAE